MQGKITYHQQVSYCGKPRCRKCREGVGHGPYWYSYQTVGGRTTRTYIGKQLPPEVQAEMEGQRDTTSPQARERDAAAIKIYSLGQFRLERRNSRDNSWETVTDSAWQHQRVRSLLTSLVSSTGRKLGREQIMDALWPDLDVEAASGRLDRAVYSLRQLFEPSRGRLATSPLVLTEREMLVLGEYPLIWVDADAFEKLLMRAHESDDPGEKENLLEEAMLLYGGDFLPEERKFELTLARRESLRRSWIGMLLELSDLRSKRDALSSAIEPLDRLLSIDPANEAAVQRLISLLAQQGRRAEAIRTYRNLAKVLQQEYRIAPLPETRALYEAVSKGTQPVRPRTSPTLPEGVGERVASGAGQAPMVQIGRAHQSPLVGRQQEIAVLQELLSSTEQAARFKLPVQKRSFAASLDPQRRPQCVLLLGDVGIGKTRLAEEASRDAQRRKWTVAWSRVYAQEATIPYRLWTEVLRKAMDQGPWQRQKMSERPTIFQPLCALLPDLQLPPSTMPVSLSPEQEQLRLWEAARELLTIISENSPLLIALDDLQWADGSSCELLAYLARHLRGYPVVIVATCRDNELPASHPLRSLMTDLQRENAIESVSLPPLSDEQIDAIVANVPSLPQVLAQQIRSRAAGNPFFAEELARTLGMLDGGEAQNGHHEEPETLPDTISAVLDLRLGRLSEPCRFLLRKAAVLGSSFTFDLTCAMEAGSDEDTVLELLEEALKSGMLNEEGTGTRITYHFWHPLLVSHLYEGLSAARRASLHRRAAEVYIRLYAAREEEFAATITHHLVQAGGDVQQIVRYAEMAGNRAYALSSYPEAEEHYRVALDHARVYTPDRVEGRLSAEQLRIARLLELLGECTRFQGKFEDARGFYEQVLDLRKRQSISGDSDEYRYEAQVQALLWCEIGVTWYNFGQNRGVLECFQQGEQVLKGAGIIAGPAWAYIRYMQSHVSGREGAYEKARHTAEEALKLFEETLKRKEYTIDHIRYPTLISRILMGDPVNLGRTHRLLAAIAVSDGHSEESLDHLRTALTLFEEHDSKRDIAIVCCNLGDLHIRKAEYDSAQSFFRRALSIAERIGDTQSVYVALNNEGVLAARLGNLLEAESWYERGLTLARGVNDPAYMSILYTYLAIVLQDQGRFEAARKSLREALSIGHTFRIAPCVGFALTTLGYVRFVSARFMIETNTEEHSNGLRILKQARNVLMKAIAMEGLEAETRTEGRLILSQVLLLMGSVDEAQLVAFQALEESSKFELLWLVAQAKRILGKISDVCSKKEESAQQFEQARRTFSKTGMRLEHARTLCEYGEVLLKWYEGDASRKGEQEYRRGLDYVRESVKIFRECGAELDLKLAERVMERYKVTEKA